MHNDMKSGTSNEVVIGKTAAGLVYRNPKTGDLTIDQNEALQWLLSGINPEVSGYYSFQYTDNELSEVWHC